MDKGREPLRRLPVAVTRTGHLIHSDNNGTETCLRSNELEETFGDPFRLAVAVAQSKFWSNKFLGTQFAIFGS